MRPRLLVSIALLALFVPSTASAKDQPGQILTWPESGTPVLRFTFGKFKEVGSLRSERTFVTDTTAENLWAKTISEASFSLYLFDKNNARIGEGYIYLSNVGKGQLVKFQTTVSASGTPASVSVVPKSLP